MTEDEAKTKWCCGPKAVSDQLLAARLMDNKLQRPNPPDANGLCIGAACMAWRMFPDTRGITGVKVEGGVATEEPPRSTAGFCGLAGKR
jgi:hypothetical protein